MYLEYAGVLVVRPGRVGGAALPLRARGEDDLAGSLRAVHLVLDEGVLKAAASKPYPESKKVDN